MELKELHAEMLRTFNEHKQTVDQRIEEIKKNGVAHPDTETKLDKMSDAMSNMQKQMDELAIKAQRPEQTSENGSKLTPEQAEYKSALVQYIRKGVDLGLSGLEAKAMSVGSDPNGGYLVTPDMSGSIVQRIFDTTPWRRYCAVQMISTDSLEGIEDRDEVSAGWVTEQGTRSETDTPEVGKWRIEVHEMYAEPKATQKLLDDANVNVEAWLSRKIADKFARTQNDAFVNGDGVGKPRGFATYTTAATADSSRTWGQVEHVATGNSADFPSSDPADKLYDIINALNPGYRGGATFACPRAVITKIRKFKITTGNGYLWQPSLVAGQPSRLLDYPVLESEDLPALASGSLSLAFANFGAAYQIVERQGIRTIRDNLTSKPYVKFYTTARVGGGVINFDAIKFLKFS